MQLRGSQKEERIAEVDFILRETYGEPVFDFGDESAVDVLIRTVLSQNTTDIVSVPAFNRIKDAYESWDDVAEAEESDIEKIIGKAGLGRIKSSRIKQILNSIKDEFGSITLEPLKGKEPEQAYAYLTALKGVGDKTASCVMLFGLSMRTFPVDTHIKRILGRLGIADSKDRIETIRSIVERFSDSAIYFRFHLNLIEHGRSVCRSKRPKCETCGLIELCEYAGQQEILRKRFDLIQG